MEEPMNDPRMEWRENRRALIEAQSKSVMVSSMGPRYYAEDKGNGVYTMGVNTCVALATDHELAHMGADWLMEGGDKIEEIIDLFKEKGEVDIFGLEESMMWGVVRKMVEEKGIVVREHLLDSSEDSFVVIVKDGKRKYFVDKQNPTFK